MEIDREALVRSFLTESDEGLAELERTAIELERSPGDRALVDRLFRIAHTLKGNASCVGFDQLTRVAHHLEDVLLALREQRQPVRPALISLLLEGTDALREMVALAASGRDELPPARAALLVRLAEYGGAPPPPAASEPWDTAPQRAVEARPQTLRVGVAKLDRLLDLVGEVAVARGRLGQVLRTEPQRALEAEQTADGLYRELEEQVLALRMIPIGPTLESYRRAVRELARATGKDAELVVQGDTVEVDMAVAAALREPLSHLVRNAIDHGIEPPALRRARAKPALGRVTLRAFHDRGTLVIEVVDDGAGIDRARVVERAVAAGLAVPESADPEALIFAVGLSTAQQVTDLSGRGVGMDAVRCSVEALRGTIAVESTQGVGTTVRLRVPLRVAIVQGFAVRSGGETYLVPLDSVVECILLAPELSIAGDGGGVLNLRGAPLPYLRLSERLGGRGERSERENVVVVEHEGKRAGIAVDALLGEVQTVVKPLGPLFDRVAGITGSAILGDGRVALHLDVRGLLRGMVAALPST